MTPERERLVRAVDEAAEKCYAAKWSRIIAENRSLKEARQALAAYDAAHPEEAQVSAMPERVWVALDEATGEPRQVATSIFYAPSGRITQAAYVPESRLLAAEERANEYRREWESAIERNNAAETRMRDMERERGIMAVSHNFNVKRAEDAEAERDALVPLARAGLTIVDGFSVLRKHLTVLGYRKDAETMAAELNQRDFTQARAILAREGT